MSRDQFHFALIDERVQAELHIINRACPIHADFSFFFDRTPDFFVWPRVHFGQVQYAGIFDGNQLVGYGMFGLRKGTLSSRTVRYFYLGDWRIHPDVRGHNLGRRAAEWLLAQLPCDVTVGIGLVKRGNRPAEHIMNTPASPTWNVHDLGPFVAANIVPIWGPRVVGHYRVDRARTSDFAEMVAVMRKAWGGRPFAPDPEMIEQLLLDLPRPGLALHHHFLARRAGRIVGLAAAWDRTSFHRATVLGYTRRGALLKGLLGLARPLWRGRLPPLPPPDAPLSGLTLTRIAIPSQNPLVLRALLGAIIAEEARGRYHLIHLGLTGGDPLLAATRGLVNQRFPSQLHLFARGSVSEPLDDPWIDLSMI